MEGKGYEDIYIGSYSPLEPSSYGSSFSNYRVPASQLGLTTDPRTNNLIDEVSKKLSHGQKVLEMTAIAGEKIPGEFLQSIPKDHFKEVERLSKLTGVDVTMHAPNVDLAGFQENRWDEQERVHSEDIMKMSIDRAYEMNPKNSIITVHSSTIPAAEFVKGMKTPGEKRTIYAVDRESRQIQPFKYEIKYYPGYEERGKEWTPEAQIESANLTKWDNEITEMLTHKQTADRMIKEAWREIGPLMEEMKKGKLTYEQVQNIIQSDPSLMRAYRELNNANLIYEDELDLKFKSLYDRAYRYAPKEVEIMDGHVLNQEQIKERLKKLGEEWVEMRKREYENAKKGIISPIEKMDEYNRLIVELKRNVPIPEQFQSVEDFAREHSAETIANSALYGYKKYGENAPTISVENIFPGTAFSRAESLKGLIKEARKKFVEQAKSTGISEGEAEKAAEKLIGATWDLGHINMLRKGGYGEKEIIEETKKIAPLVKHVHISDNFGIEHIELPPGMGTVPIKELLKELEKQGFSGKKILEVGNWWQNFGKISPLPYSLEALDSPIYGMVAQPTWAQARGTYGNYIAGPYAVFPEQHFGMFYGSGMSGLPSELGGQIPGKQSRLSGAPTD